MVRLLKIESRTPIRILAGVLTLCSWARHSTPLDKRLGGSLQWKTCSTTDCFVQQKSELKSE